MLRTQVQLTEEQASELRSLAAERSTSVADLVRQAVDRLLRDSPLVSWAERRERALTVAGRFRSGHQDLAEEHDRHLADVYSSE